MATQDEAVLVLAEALKGVMYAASEKSTDTLLAAMADMETQLGDRIDTTNANMQEQFASVRADFSEHREEVKQLLNGQDRSSV